MEFGELQHMQIMDGDCQRIVTPEEALQVTGDAGNGPANEKVKGIVAGVRQPTIILPYLLGIGDRLRQIANKYNVRTWYTFPGKTADLFNAYRGKLHKSKSRYSVYQAHCSCGLRYVGETNCNLKVHICEHLKNSSHSALAKHLKFEKQRYPQTGQEHSVVFKDTQILAAEKNTLKRKIIESLIITSKAPRLCNEGPSIDLAPIWGICQQGIDRQLEKSE